MKRDINTILYLVPIGLIILGSLLETHPWDSVLVISGFFLLGSACIFNFKKCGRIHCLITGPVFFLLGLLVLLLLLDVVNIKNGTLQIILVAGLVLGYGAELWYRRTHGTCYIKKLAEQ